MHYQFMRGWKENCLKEKSIQCGTCMNWKERYEMVADRDKAENRKTSYSNCVEGCDIY